MCVDAQQYYPKPRANTTLLEGDWNASPIVAVGNVTSVTRYGDQTVDRLPPPTLTGVHKLYWCKGDFQIISVIKGELDASPKKYLWASTLPGCKLWPNDPDLIFHRQKTRAWFLREEGEFLRPTYDYGTYRYIGILAKWEDGPRLPERQRLGTLLVTPAANCDTLEDYTDYLGQVVDIACELLGKAECVRRIRDLAGLGNSALKELACGFLKAELEEDCDVPR